MSLLFATGAAQVRRTARGSKATPLTLLGQGRSGVAGINYTVGRVVSGFELRVSVVPRRKLGPSRLLYGLGQPLPGLILFSDAEGACVLELLLVQVLSLRPFRRCRTIRRFDTSVMRYHYNKKNRYETRNIPKEIRGIKVLG